MILLRPATLADVELLRTWRNDSEMRKNSFHSSVVGKQEHLHWLRKSLKSETRRIYIAEFTHLENMVFDLEKGIFNAERITLPVGEGRLDYTGDAIEFDIEVAPVYRGQGYGRQILAALVAEAHKWKPSVPLVAHVKAFNTASLRMFLGAGFEVRGNQCLTLERR